MKKITRRSLLRTIAVAATVVATSATLVACANDVATSTDASSASSEPTTSTTAPSTPTDPVWPEVNLQYININSESMGGEKVQAMVDEFNKSNDKNITVEFNYISGNYQEIASEVQSYLAAGQDVGVVQVGYSYINYFAENFPQLQDINNVISTYAPEDSAYLSEVYDEPVLNLGQALNGELAGLSYGMSSPLLYMNVDICKAAGLDINNPPKTWEEVAQWSATIKEKTGNYGVSIQNPADTWSILPMFLSAGVDSVINTEADGSYSANLYSEDTVAAWTLLQDMVKADNCVQLTLEEGVASFVGGNIGMYLTTSGRAAYFSSNCEFELMSVVQPGFEGFDPKACIGGNVLSIITEEPDQIKASWEFIKFLQQPENIATWCEATGYLPPTKNSADNANLKAYMDGNELMKAALDGRQFAAQWVSWPGKNGLQIDQALINVRDSIMGTLDDADTVIKNAEAEINGLLAK